MIELQKSTAVTVGVVMIRKGTTAELTGVTGSQVTCYVWYGGTNTSAQVPYGGANGFSWNEVNPNNMPGLYGLTLPASVISTVGDFIVYVYASTSNNEKREFYITTNTSEDIGNLLFGRWRIDTTANTMTFYQPDGVTALAEFNLLDNQGNPSYDNVYERDPT